MENPSRLSVIRFYCAVAAVCAFFLALYSLALILVKLTERYADFAELTPAILNEFISRIEVHERDQKRATVLLCGGGGLCFFPRSVFPRFDTVILPLLFDIFSAVGSGIFPVVGAALFLFRFFDAEIKEQLSAFENAGGRAQRFVKLTERYADFAELTPAILNELISCSVGSASCVSSFSNLPIWLKYIPIC